MKHKIKIALFATVTDFGGAERVILALLKNINKDLFEVSPIIFTRSELLENIFFKRLGGMGWKYHTIFANDHKIKYLNPLQNLMDAYKLLRRYEYNLVHTHGYRADIIGIALSKLLGLPVVSTCHGFISNDVNLRIYNKLDRFILKYANRIIAVSEGIKHELTANGIKESKIALIKNAIERYGNEQSFNKNRKAKRDLLNISTQEFVIGYVGRLSEEKGIRHLLEAHILLNRAGIPVKLMIIGEGPQRKQLEDIVKNERIDGRVIFAGFQSEIENWLPAMDVFVLPSLTEGTPMSLLEAMAEGIPVVASAVGGVPQVIYSGENGMLVSASQPEEIKSAIQLLYNNEPIRTKISAAAQEMIKSNYGVKDWIGKIEKIHLEVVKTLSSPSHEGTDASV